MRDMSRYFKAIKEGKTARYWDKQLVYKGKMSKKEFLRKHGGG